MILSNSSADTRYFVYEVSGLHLKNQPAKNDTYILNDNGNALIQVPYNRMNEQMQTILRRGGKIVNIRPLNENLSAEG
ncbi:phycobilisome linker polypeptide [Pseudanabaena mucicola]|uniref:Phycobilisome linker polypeptide n=1 Tax=Pseudanabaena mucicola FACHB-723 TaxID=2692860 RepID=A0ABR7ZW91_9CYAN|nr:phycobilisome linker polypeptide [Pseudanabaena mucicola]MBD2188241.1 phycobilisome linker polypeptide [Pseudanabaena mucicola FACHB-723]